MKNTKVNLEKEIIVGKCKPPILHYVFYESLFVIFSILFLIPIIIYLINNSSTLYIILSPFLFIFGLLAIFFLPVFIIRAKNIRKCYIKITNQRVFGTNISLVNTYEFSYSLKSISSIKYRKFFGVETIIIKFGNGKSPTIESLDEFLIGGFAFQFLVNGREVYEKLEDAIINNNVKEDISLGKSGLPIKSDESSAKEDLAYINEIRALKGLLDEGIITNQEFEEKKKELLATRKTNR